MDCDSDLDSYFSGSCCCMWPAVARSNLAAECSEGASSRLAGLSWGLEAPLVMGCKVNWRLRCAQLVAELEYLRRESRGVMMHFWDQAPLWSNQRHPFWISRCLNWSCQLVGTRQLHFCWWAAQMRIYFKIASYFSISTLPWFILTFLLVAAWLILFRNLLHRGINSPRHLSATSYHRIL